MTPNTTTPTPDQPHLVCVQFPNREWAEEFRKWLADPETRIGGDSVEDMFGPDLAWVEAWDARNERAQKLRELVAEVVEWHSNPDSPHHNLCESVPCLWCMAAKQSLEETTQ